MYDKSSETKSKMQEKRETLKALSNTVKPLKQEGEIETINEGLKKLYAQSGHTELKTLKQWNESGKRVKKGEHALLLWAKPKKITTNQENQLENTGEDNPMNFFPICFVFSNLQVLEAQ
jgi:hypothetical protein